MELAFIWSNISVLPQQKHNRFALVTETNYAQMSVTHQRTVIESHFNVSPQPCKINNNHHG